MPAERHPVTEDCEGHWRMDQSEGSSEPDDSGSEANLVESGGTIPTIDSVPFFADDTSRDPAELVGSEMLTTRTAIFNGHATCTISTWVRVTEGLTPNVNYPVMVVRKGTVFPGDPVYIRFQLRALAGVTTPPMRASCTVNMSGDDVSLTGPYDIEAGWHLISVRIGYGSAELLVDAVEVATDSTVTGTTLIGTNPTDEAELEMCNSTRSGYGVFCGYVSDTAIYSTKKSTAWLREVLEGFPTTPTPEIQEARIIAFDTLRVLFSGPVAVDDNMLDLNNWSITPGTIGATEIEVRDVRGFEADAVVVDFVDLEISRGTKEAVYLVTATNLRTADGAFLGDVDLGDVPVRHSITADCIGHWAMDGAEGEDEPDDSGYGNTLIESNGTIPILADSPFGDGSTSRDPSDLVWGGAYFAATNDLSIFDGLANYTISVWAFVSTITNPNFGYPIFLLRTGGANYIYFAIGAGGGQSDPPFRLDNVDNRTGDNCILHSTFTLTAGWHLLTTVVSGDSSLATLYIDAVEVATDESVGGVTDTIAATVLEVGNGSYSTTAALPAAIADLAAYSTAKDEDWMNEILTGPEVVPGVYAPFVYQHTKVDAILALLPEMYNTGLDSNIRQILSAIAIQDEEIGGRPLTILPSGGV